MRLPPRGPHHRIPFLLAVVWSVVVPIATSGAATDGEARWFDREGNPLPFTSDDEIEDFLARAEIMGKKSIDGGTNKPTRYDLELDGVRARAIFRTVEVADVEGPGRTPNPLRVMRDSWVHEIAAWELSRLLGLDHVPPAIERKMEGRSGSLQLWVEQGRTEGARIEAGEPPRQPASWHRQRQAMLVFDNLIYNFDRNHGNQLFDERGKMWFIDHTRSFAKRPELFAPEHLRFCQRDLWARLQELDAASVEEAIGDWIDRPGIQALLSRRDLLVRLFEEKISERGAETVLLD